MSGENKVVELWGDQSVESTLPSDSAEARTATPPASAYLASYDEAPGDDQWQDPRGSGNITVVLALFAFAAIWISANLIANLAAIQALIAPPYRLSLIQAAHSIDAALPVMLLILVAWLAIRRSGDQNGVSLNKTLMHLRRERNDLAQLIANSEQRLSEGAHAIYVQGEQLDALGTATVNKIATLRAMLDEEIAQIAVQSNGLRNAAAAARSDMAVLLANLPKAQAETRKITEALEGAGSAAEHHTVNLTAQLTALEQQSVKAEMVAVEAADLLAAQIREMMRHSNAAQVHVTDCLDTLKNNEENQLSSLLDRATQINTEIAAIGTGLANHDGLSAKLLDRLRNGLADVEGRLAAIDTHGTERTERLSDAIKSLTDHSHHLREELSSGGDRTQQLIADAEGLLVALDAAARELDETLPASLERVARVTAVTHGRIAEAADQAEAIGTQLKANLADLDLADSLIASHQDRLARTQAALTDQTEAAKSFADVISGVQAQMDTVAGGASVELVEALVRVRETAKIASERAHQAITSAIPDAVAALGHGSEKAFREALDKSVTEQLAHVSDVAAQAVLAANEASDRLMRQMLTISETSAAFAEQLRVAEQTHEASAQTTLSRRVSLLIESLNSISIDVTKILSNEVTDAAWTSYLKGDRGVFTRRAVKLIDAADMRDILRHYDSDTDFRAHVNHYIHDFEAMLRVVLNSRESGPLSVTLLSSDMGKLYVALAHAIERLRT